MRHLAATTCLGLSLSACAAMGAEIRVAQKYDWPDTAELCASVQAGDLLVISRIVPRPLPGNGLTTAGADFGACLPWLRCGPLLTRGMLRIFADPLGYTASSGVFRERTTLVLDGALRSSNGGMLLMPLPDLLGVFYRGFPAGGNECGAFGRIPLGPLAAAEAAIVVSQPVARPVPDDWFFPRGPFPGGKVTDLGGRLVLDSPALSFSFAAGASSAEWAAPGAFASLWACGRAPPVQAALLLCGATPGYRAPDGAATSGASRVSTAVRLGIDPHAGILDAGCSYTVSRPCFAPHAEIAARTTLTVQLSRDFELAAVPVSLLVQAEKDINRDPDGVQADAARCACFAAAGFHRLDASAGVKVSDRNGVALYGAAGLKPSPTLRISVEARGEGLGAASPVGSTTVTLAFEREGQGAALKTGIEDCPLAASRSGLSGYFRLSLSCFVRQADVLDRR